jgi:hypothetical protein
MTGAVPPARDDAPSRLNEGWLSAAEDRALAWLALRIPGWLSPDRLTALGFAGAIIAFLGYLLARPPFGVPAAIPFATASRIGSTQGRAELNSAILPMASGGSKNGIRLANRRQDMARSIGQPATGAALGMADFMRAPAPAASTTTTRETFMAIPMPRAQPSGKADVLLAVRRRCLPDRASRQNKPDHIRDYLQINQKRSMQPMPGSVMLPSTGI